MSSIAQKSQNAQNLKISNKDPFTVDFKPRHGVTIYLCLPFAGDSVLLFISTTQQCSTQQSSEPTYSELFPPHNPNEIG